MIIKVAADCIASWTVNYTGSAVSFDRGTAITLTSSGYVVASGWFFNASGGIDRVIVAYDTNGNQLWVTRYPGPIPSNYGDVPSVLLAIDASDNIYVGASLAGVTIVPESNIGVLKLKPDGTLSDSWPDVGFGTGVRQLDLGWGGNDEAKALVTDAAGNVTITGNVNPGGFIATARFAPDGTLLWQRTELPPSAGDATPAAIALDPAGNTVGVGPSASIESITG